MRYWAWTKVSWLNARHLQFAWISLGTLMLSDLYILLLASGAYPADSWQVHFRDTMRVGKFLNNWRMAELHGGPSGPARIALVSRGPGQH